MGAKNSKSQFPRKTFHSQEEERILRFFGLKSSNQNISSALLKKKWDKMLVPNFANQLQNYLIKESQLKDKEITMDAMASLYITFVRGTLDEMATLIAEFIDSEDKDENLIVISYKSVLTYLGDLICSYLTMLEYCKDPYLMSWSASSHKSKPASLPTVVKAWTVELLHVGDDQVYLQNLEVWLAHTGMVTLIHNLVITTLFNLNDSKTSLIPRACLPTPKTSSILDSTQVMYLNSLLPSEYRSRWRFLFSTATHGESFSTMMGSITNQGPTLLIIKDSHSHTFGGFASESWLPGPKFVGNETCFLFTLTPEIKMFTATGYNKHFMYVNCNQTSLPNGLGMGGQFGYWGLWLDYQFGLGECSESCTTYRNYTMLAANKRFNIAHLEIWGVGDPPPTPAEMGERVSSVLDKDPTVTQMLAMIGRKQHSKGLRESPGRVKPMFPEDQEGE